MALFEIRLGLTGDRAEAETFDAALLAAATLVEDAFDGAPTQGTTRAARESLYITLDGLYHPYSTALARDGHRRRLSASWSD